MNELCVVYERAKGATKERIANISPFLLKNNITHVVHENVIHIPLGEANIPGIYGKKELFLSLGVFVVFADNLNCFVETMPFWFLSPDHKSMLDEHMNRLEKMEDILTEIKAVKEKYDIKE